MSAAVAFVGAHALVLLVLAATAHAAGSLAWRPFGGARQGAMGGGGTAPEPRLADAAVVGALGLVALGTLGGLLGLVDMLRAGPLAVAMVAIHLAALAARRRSGPRARSDVPGSRRSVLVRAGLALVALAPLFALAIYPPTAFDETLYHLPFARAFAASGGLPFLPELRFPVFPQLAEVLAAEVLLFAGDVATHLVQLLAALLTAGLLVAWGSEWGSGEGPDAGRLAAAAWLGNPLVVYLAGTGYVEPLLALFATAACWAFWRWRRDGRDRWLALAAAFAGAGAATKYLGLYFVGLLALGALLAPPVRAEGTSGGRVRALALFGAVATLVMAPWYARIVALTANPVFPYLPGIFGEHDWMPLRFRDPRLPSTPAAWVAGLADAGARLVTLPFDVVARRHLVGALPPISPAYLAGLPLLAAAAVRDRTLRRLLLLAGGFVAFFPWLPADARYLVTVLPLVSLGLGVGIARLLRRWARGRERAASVALALLLALPGWLYAGYRLARQGSPPVTHGAREAYLLRALPLYPAVARANALLRPGDRLYGLFAEEMRDHVRGAFLGDWYGPHRFQELTPLLGEPEALHARLRGWDVDLLLVAKDPEVPPVALTPPGAPFELLYEDSAAALYALRAGEGASR